MKNYDIQRGDWLHCPDGSFRVTRYDAKREVIVATDGARTIQISDLVLDYGDAILERKEAA